MGVIPLQQSEGLKNRIVFMGGKQVGFSSLLFLLENAEILNIEVVAVFENSVSPLASEKNSARILAIENDIPVYSETDQLLKLSNIDFIFSVQYGKILKPDEIAVAKNLALNLHMAPLPEYRGCNQFSYAIIDQAKYFGTTLHVLEPDTDAGDILFEKRFEITGEPFVTQLYDQTLELSIDLFKESVQLILEGKFRRITQKSLLNSRSTSFHFRKEIDSIKRIDATWPIEKQKRYFRATYFPQFSPPVLVNNSSEKLADIDWYHQLK